VRQIPGENRRRWFYSRTMDLIVWVAESGKIVGFQLCYDRERDERALIWRAPRYFTHMAVDDGEGRAFRHKASPILTPSGGFSAPRLAEAFRQESADLPPDIARLVSAKIAAFGRRKA